MADQILGTETPKAPGGPSPMSDEDLLNLIGDYERSSLGSDTASGATTGNTYYNSNQLMTTLEIDRYNALNTYFARPIGNETENSSQVVLPELRDTVEWIMPQLMRIFLASKTPCVFDAEGPDDVDRAQRETEAVNHVFMRLNAGFFVIHDYCKDALLLRNGYVRSQSVQEEYTREEEYSGLDEIQLEALLSDKGDEQVEIIGQSEEVIDIPPPLDAPPGTPYQQQTTFSVRLRITGKRRKVLVEAIPPEELRIASGTRGNDLDASRFVAHVTEKTRSELIEEGHDPAIVNAAQPGKPSWLEMDALARDQTIDQLQTNDPAEFASQKVQFRSVTIQCDFDGDGIAERRQVLICGDKIVENEIIEECPISSGVPKRMPHRHTGISLYDELVDIQVIKSELARQGLNNLRLANNGRIGVDWKNCNLSDLMVSRAGGVVRTNGNPAGVLMPFQHPSNLMDQVIPMMQYVDTWRTMRTGVGEHTMGLDADALQDVTKGGQLAAMSAASLKIEMIARLLAEGLKDVFLKIHALLIRHQDQPLKFQMGSQWVEELPTSWKKRTRISPNVGLGSGNREEARANLAMLNGMQDKAAQFGLIGPQQMYNTFKLGVSLLGYEHPEQFAMDPKSPEYKQAMQQRMQQPPDPRIAAAQINAGVAKEKIQADQLRAQAEEHTEQIRAQAEITHEAIQAQADRQAEMSKSQMDLVIQVAKIIAPILAGQLKQDPSANAGQMLRQDVQSFEGRA